MNTGRIVQVVGPVIDVEFPPKSMPAILNALHIDGTTDEGKVKIHLTAEVMQHIGNNIVRAVAMSSTDGLVRGMEVVDTGAPISVPVGPGVLGRIFNVLGETVTMMTLRLKQLITGLFIDRLRALTNRLQLLKFWKPALKSLTLSLRMQWAVKSVCSAVLA